MGVKRTGEIALHGRVREAIPTDQPYHAGTGAPDVSACNQREVRFSERSERLAKVCGREGVGRFARISKA